MKFKNSYDTILSIKNQIVNVENENIDYKLEFHFTELRDKLELIKDIVSIANTDGGCIIYGVRDKNFEWVGLDENSNEVNDIQIRDFMSGYVTDLANFQIGPYTIDDEDYYFLTIDKNEGDLISFKKDGVYDRIRKKGNKSTEYVFKKNDQYGRIGSSNRPINLDKTFKMRRNRNNSIISNLNTFSRPYKDYVERPIELSKMLDSLNNDNIRNVQINGLGGIGKTSFVRNFCDKLESGNLFMNIKINFIIWITGKMDLFLPSGEIDIIRTSELSFNEMLDLMANVLSIDTYNKSDEELSFEILNTFKNYNSLIVFDNMETIKDPKITDFIRNISSNCRVIFTTRINLTTVYDRIDLDGFDLVQFSLYLKNQLLYYDNRNSIDFDSIEPYIKDLCDLVHGSPLIANMIVYKICTGYELKTLLGQLRQMKKNSSYYDKVMDFCFDDILSSLTILEKKILFIMSISDNVDEYFQISDLKYILACDDMDINHAVSKLFNVSFCNKKNDLYSCSSLVKVFTNKKLSKNKEIEILNITEKYYEWINKQQKYNKLESNLYTRVKAYDFERKEAVLQIRNILYNYDNHQEYEETINDFDKLINKYPTYSYVYFKKAIFEKSTNRDRKIISQCFERAIFYDNKNDYYISEYAFYLSEIKENESAIKYFTKALQINDSNPSTNHGIAICYTKYYNNKTELFSECDKIKYHFVKGYFTESGRYEYSHNARNAHAHAKYLYEIKEFELALKYCKKGFDYTPDSGALKTLYSSIMRKIDPNYVSYSKLNEIRSGIFADASEEILKKVYKLSS